MKVSLSFNYIDSDKETVVELQSLLEKRVFVQLECRFRLGICLRDVATYCLSAMNFQNGIERCELSLTGS